MRPRTKRKPADMHKGKRGVTTHRVRIAVGLWVAGGRRTTVVRKEIFCIYPLHVRACVTRIEWT